MPTGSPAMEDDVPVVETAGAASASPRPSSRRGIVWLLLGALAAGLLVVFLLVQARKTPSATALRGTAPSTTSAAPRPSALSTAAPLASPAPSTASPSRADITPTGVRHFFEGEGWDVYWSARERIARCTNSAGNTTITITPGSRVVTRGTTRVTVPQTFTLNAREGRLYNTKQSLLYVARTKPATSAAREHQDNTQPVSTR